MRLKKIKLKGFKSFADETVLTFDPGITAIVGPNGCGKSNIADAFRWVLGEQSAKSLRGQKMPDVIFAGTATRKPMNFAEATIIFDQVGGALPVEYDEVAVTRRLHRSGESEYFINKHPVRLKDIQSMFLGTGVGKNAISIFEQGKIDQVISLTPLERRGIFEEVAGIGRFLMSKKDALRRLEQTDQNLVRVHDILKEVERQMLAAEKQAEKASAYHQNKQRLDALELSLLVTRWDRSRKESDKIQAQHQELLQMENQLKSRYEGWEKALQQTKKELEKTEIDLKSRRDAFFEARSAKEILIREKQSSNDRYHEMLARKKQLTLELDELANKLQNVASEIESKQSLQKEGEKEVAAASQQLHLVLNKTEQMERDLAILREKQVKGQQERLKCVQTESQTENSYKQFSMRLDHLHEEWNKLVAKQSTGAQQLQNLQLEVQTKEEQNKKFTEVFDEIKSSVSSMHIQIHELEKDLEEKKQKLFSIQRSQAQLQARHQTLIKLRQAMEGFSSGTKKLLQAVQKNSSLTGLVRGLYEVLVVPREDQARLAPFLERYSQTLVVKTRSDLQRLLFFAQEQGIKGFSLLCLELVPGDIEGLLSYLTSDVKWVDQLQEISAGDEIFSAEGYHLDLKGILFCRDTKNEGQADIFRREAELRDLSKELEIFEKNALTAEQGLAKQQERHQILRREMKEKEEALRQAESRQMQSKFAFEKSQADYQRVLNEKERLSGEIEAVEKKREQLQIELEKIKQQHDQAQSLATKSQQQAVTYDAQFEEASAAFRLHQRQHKDQESIYQKLLEKHQKLEYDLNLFQARKEEISQRQNKLVAEIQRNEILVVEVESKKIGQQEIDAVQVKLESQESLCREGENAVVDKKKQLEVLDQEGNDLRRRMKENDEANYKMGILLAQLTTTCEGIEKELEEHYLLTVDDARGRQIELSQGIQSAENEVKKLKRSLEALGAVNMTALEEFEEHSSRYKFLSEQMEDLAKTKSELLAIITELDSKSRILFEESFKAIRENFQKNFKILFNGGEADLQFTEAEDILEAGIDIVAKPPGKQMRSISLLSGGEKCMTAMALLFAFFEVKPAPFCILDEIDAPLDDSNIGRFVEVVKQFIDRCQFVIITHNKRTMAIADVLFGVSMEQKGVSKLLSMTFNTLDSVSHERKSVFSGQRPEI